MWRAWASVPLIILSLLGASQASAGASSDWVVRKSSGLVEYTMMGAEAVPVESGDFLAPGMSIKTGENGRARLERGEEWLVVLPNTLVTILAEPDPGMDTTLKVEMGKIGVHVQKQVAPHFSVGAPNLVAVVKGTTFTVTADGQQSNVAVIEGLVEVTSRTTAEAKDVAAGHTASVTLDGSMTVKQSDASDSNLLRSELGTDGLTGEASSRVGQPTEPGQPAPKAKKSKSKGKGKGKGKSKGNYGSSSGPGGYHGDDDHSHHSGKGKGKG